MINIRDLIFNYEGQTGIAYRSRERRAQIFKDFVHEVSHYKAQNSLSCEISILDVGGTEAFWKSVGSDCLIRNNIRICLLNLPGFVKPIEDHKVFSAVEGNGCNIEFPDNSFDIAFSNSVIEHVGGMRDMRKFARECQRVARFYYCQTPSYWFPVEPHFLFPLFNFLPEPIRVYLIRRASFGNMPRQKNILDAYEAVQSAQLLTAPAMQALFPGCKFHRERFAFFIKSYTAFGESALPAQLIPH